MDAKAPVLIRVKVHVLVDALGHAQDSAQVALVYVWIHVMHLVQVNALDAHHVLDALVHVLATAPVDVTEHALVDVVTNVTVGARHLALHAQANVLDVQDALDARLSALDVKYLVLRVVISHVLPDVRLHVKRDVMVALPNALARALSLVKSFA